MSALRRELRERGWFERKGIGAPNLASVLDLVALGTVADVVPLDRNNRILVQQGLLRMRAGQTRPGIAALLDIAGRGLHRVVASDLSFAVAPRLNAAGRLDDMSVGIACLLAERRMEATSAPPATRYLNRDRQQIERGMQEEARQHWRRWTSRRRGKSAQQHLPVPNPAGTRAWWVSWPHASRTAGTGRLLPSPTATTAAPKGSARSIPGLHIRDVLDRVASSKPGLVSKFGGHAMAAGLSLPEDTARTLSRRRWTIGRQRLD